MSDSAVGVGRVVVLCPLSFESAAVRLVRGVMGRLGLSKLVVERGGRGVVVGWSWWFGP